MSHPASQGTYSIITRLTHSLRSTLDAVRYFSGLLFRNAPVASTLLILGNMATGLSTPVVVWSMDGLITQLSGELANPWVHVLPWLAALAAALLLRSADSALTTFLSNSIRQRVDGAMYREVANKAIRIPLDAFESSTYYDKLETGQRAIRGHLVHVLDALAALVAAGAGVAGLMLLFAQAHPGLIVVLIASVVLASVVQGKQSAYFNQVNYGSSPRRREIGYWAGLLSSHRAAAEIRLFQLSCHILSRWRAAFDGYLADINQARKRIAVGGFISGAVQELIGWATTVAILVLTLGGAMGVGTMVAMLYGVGRFRDLVGHFSWTVAELVDHWSELKHLRSFLELPDEHSARGSHPAPRPIRHGVTFHNVSFTYPGAKRPALHDVSFTLYPGESVALVGENGAGKSTLVRLLLGLYQPTEGYITVDNIRLTDIDMASWRREASVVFQDYMRYPATVHENIGFGDVDLLQTPHGDEEHPKIVAAAQKSGVDQMVQQLPSGYSTLLSKQFEGGTELSTGQWQRLALARAHVRNAQIMVLDEPTAALDPKAEVEVYRQFQRAAAGTCAVFISHRLGSARLADRIVVLKEGRIVEVGAHDELLAQGGEYARMFLLQAEWYSDRGEVAMG